MPDVHHVVFLLHFHPASGGTSMRRSPSYHVRLPRPSLRRSPDWSPRSLPCRDMPFTVIEPFVIAASTMRGPRAVARGHHHPVARADLLRARQRAHAQCQAARGPGIVSYAVFPLSDLQLFECRQNRAVQRVECQLRPASARAARHAAAGRERYTNFPSLVLPGRRLRRPAATSKSAYMPPFSVWKFRSAFSRRLEVTSHLAVQRSGIPWLRSGCG